VTLLPKEKPMNVQDMAREKMLYLLAIPEYQAISAR
jgi:hypothetical protein